jgi:hypothetical protein
MSGDTPETRTVIVESPSKPRPDDPLTVAVADTLRRVENNYNREGSGPGSRFEGELLEDVQARRAIAMVRSVQAESDAAGSRWTERLGPVVACDHAELEDAYAAAHGRITELEVERDKHRELLDEVGVLAANAPEDGDSFGLLEQIAMRIAAVDVPDTTPIDEWPAPENPVTGRTPGAADVSTRELAYAEDREADEEPC